MYLSRRDIVPGSDIHRLVIEEVRRRVKHSEREYQNKHETWRKSDETHVAYVHETEADAKRRNKRDVDGEQSYTTIRVPYAYGVAMSLHAYLTSVFLGRSPVFQFDGVHGEAQNQCMALEALIDYQYRVAMFGPKMFSWIYDICKYGAGSIGEYWGSRINHVSYLVPILNELGEVEDYEEVVEEVVPYTGNEIFNVSIFDFLPDPRVTFRDFQKGEYCATRQRLSWQQIKEREAQGFYINVDHVDPRIVPNFPTDNDRNRESRAIERPSDDIYNVDQLQAGMDTIKRPEIVPVYETFIRLVPADWGLGPSTYPTMWVFTVTGDWRTVLSAGPFGAYHCEFPYHVGEMEMDAQALVNRGVPEILEGVQQTMDWLLNSRMYNVRAANNNLFLVDPLRVNVKDITDPLPGGLIRKRGGMANPGDKALEQLTIFDVTQRNINDMELMKNVGEQGLGISDLLMGATPQGGRRTATESRQTAASGTSRAKLVAEYLGCSGMVSLANHTVSNSQQYYDGSMKLKIVGNLAEQAGMGFMQVTPDLIQGKFGYVVADGTMPLDRFAQINMWKELISAILMDPAMAGQFDIARIFMWVAQLGGLRNVQSFRLQATDPMALQQQVAAGNVVPITQGERNPDNLRQLSGMGGNPVGSIYGT